MPPQPLSSVRRDARPIADPAALGRQPTLATLVAEIIATWSRIESTLGNTLGMMLRAGVQVSAAMYRAIFNFKIQMDVLEAAARLSLSQEDFELFGAIMVIVKRTGTKRHNLAHGLWGYTDGLPNALILFDPDEVLTYSASIADFMRSMYQGNFEATYEKPDLSKIFVYREKDLSEILSEMRSVDEMTKTFATLSFGPRAPLADQLRTQLLGEPQIQAELNRIRARNRNAP